MTEKEKMLAGEWHDANFDADLLAERAKAESLCFDFNMSRPGCAEQLAALKALLGTDIPDGLTVLAPVYFDYGAHTRLGEGTFVNHGCYFMDGGAIEIGKNVFIGPFCGFYTASHPMDYATRNRGLERALPKLLVWRERVGPSGSDDRERMRHSGGERRHARPAG